MKKSLSLLIIAIIALTSSINASAKWTDHNTFNLKGPVKDVYENEYVSLSFYEDGTLYLMNGERVIIESRDKVGRITALRWAEMPQFNSYTYNKKGFITEERSSGGTCAFESTIKYAYNAKGQVVKQTWDGEITTYTYQKFDKYGNWIKRTAKTGRKSTVETRTITYYE